MSLLDGVLLGGLGLGVWRGLQTGAAVQIAGIVGWILGFVAAAAWGDVAGDLAVASLGLSPRTAPLVGAGVVFAGVAGGTFAVAHGVRKTLQAIKLGAVDALAGAGVGGLRAAVGLSLVLAALSFAPFGEPLLLTDDACASSALCEPVRAVAPGLWKRVNGEA